MHSGRKERRLKTIERIGWRTGFVVAAPGRALPLTARVRGHSRTRPSRTVRRQWRLRRLTHTLMQTRETYSPHTHTHTHKHTHSRDTNASARSATHGRQRLLFHIWRRLRLATVICCLVIIRPFVWCDRLVSIPCRYNSIVVSWSDFDRISLFCVNLYYLHVAVAHTVILTYLRQLRVVCARVHFVLFV